MAKAPTLEQLKALLRYKVQGHTAKKNESGKTVTMKTRLIKDNLTYQEAEDMKKEFGKEGLEELRGGLISLSIVRDFDSETEYKKVTQATQTPTVQDMQSKMEQMQDQIDILLKPEVGDAPAKKPPRQKPEPAPESNTGEATANITGSSNK